MPADKSQDISAKDTVCLRSFRNTDKFRRFLSEMFMLCVNVKKKKRNIS